MTRMTHLEVRHGNGGNGGNGGNDDDDDDNDDDDNDDDMLNDQQWAKYRTKSTKTVQYKYKNTFVIFSFWEILLLLK